MDGKERILANPGIASCLPQAQSELSSGTVSDFAPSPPFSSVGQVEAVGLAPVAP